MFERSLEPHADGFLYFPFARRGGYLLTVDEKQTLVAERRRMFGFVGILKIIAIMLVTSAIEYALYVMVGWSTQDITPFLASAVLLIYILWGASSGVRLVWEREPVVPPRSRTQNYQAVVRILGLPFFAILSVVALFFFGLLIYAGALLTPEQPLIGIPLLLMSAFFVVSWLRQIIALVTER